MDSSSTSSPFSTRSTIPSSPEAIGGDTNSALLNPSFKRQPASHSGLQSSAQLMQSMQAILSNLAGASSFSSIPGSDFLRQSPNPADVKPNISDGKSPASAFQMQSTPSARASPAAVAVAPSVGGSGHGGSRTEPPRRVYEVDGLAVVTPTVDDIAASYPNRNRILLQGDPQVIHKQRVETAIRVIIDVLRLIPPSPSNPPVPPTLATILPRDASGNIMATFERLGAFRGLRLQAGTTTKASSKKQLQAGALPPHQVAYVETAVYTSGENRKRVYACKRCTAREERRRKNKDAARKKQVATDSESSTPRIPRPSLRPPSEDYITGENQNQYDPHRVSQIVEEPPWDPTVPDWRHEIVLFNSPPEVPMKEGSCFWLPFRVICYCKCHGEKVGFRIKFTLRTFDGKIIASDMTHPIKITDDHKTDAKSKPRLEGMTSALASVAPARPRKSRMGSTVSSTRQSPAPSESDMSVTSDIGAVTQKQTPSARQGKPYERPPSQSPAVQHSVLPFEFMQHQPQQQGHAQALQDQRPRLARQVSASSYASQSDITNWSPDAAQQATVSPDALRRPNFSTMNIMTNSHNLGVSKQSPVAPSPGQPFGGSTMGLSNGFNSNNSNNLGTQLPNGMGHNHFTNGLHNLGGSNDIFNNAPLNGLPHTGPLNLSTLGGLGSNQMLFNTQSGNTPSGPANGGEDAEMANVANELQNMLFGGSQAGSVSSSVADDASAFSSFQTGSLFSDSGLPPDNALDDMIDYSGGESTGAISPMQHLNLSPGVPLSSADLSGQSPFVHNNRLPPQQDPDAQTRALLALLAQQQSQRQQHQPVPVVSHVIPAEGDMAGGTPVAIAGRLFSPDTVIVFGGRPAITTYVTDSFLQCTLPPSPVAGDVEVTVQGHMRDPNEPVMMFKYTGMDKEMMRLMLEVRQLHQSSDPAVRLVDHIARSNHNSDLSDRSSVSPAGNISSPFDATDAPAEDGDTITNSTAEEKDLETILIDFVDALDEPSPGALRRSGAINLRNKAEQTLTHIAVIMGFTSLLQRLILVGAHLNLQDANGFTPLAFAALCGQANCAQVLLDAGASYDMPTFFGERPLDLAKSDEKHDAVESILLSVIWFTNSAPDVPDNTSSSPSAIESNSEIDDDNPSSGSDEGNSISAASRVLRDRTRRPSRRLKGKHRNDRTSAANSPTRQRHRRIPVESTSQDVAVVQQQHATPLDDPPPYAPPEQGSWMARTLNNFSHPLPDGMWHGLPSLWNSEKQTPHGWVAFPAPSWDTLQKMTSPEEVKLFTQAMAAAALNAVVQSGATASVMGDTPGRATTLPSKKRTARRKSTGESSGRERDTSASEGRRPAAKQIRRDRMLYLFWLPVLLFVGFWLLVTALPIATGFCLLYARQISRAIKQRL